MDAAKITKRVRALDGLTRSELARLSGLAPSTVGRIEDGKLDPTVKTLASILESTGFKPYGDTIVSAGDPAAVAAARVVLERRGVPQSALFRAVNAAMSGVLATASSSATAAAAPAASVSAAIAPAVTATTTSVLQPIASGVVAATQPVAEGVTGVATAMARWIDRWRRAGWVAEDPEDDNVTAIGVAAGNAAKFARRSSSRRYVDRAAAWEILARQIGDAGFEYAVSGLVAVRDKRAGTGATAPIIYVDDPDAVIRELNLAESSPIDGVLLIAPSLDELAGAEEEDGIRFVSQAQALLDAFASGGRQPEKAEAIARSWRTNRTPESMTL
ncbi:Helix-turn-helix [Leifsonia sp. CL147]|nr:Helix-turn-helix [Leifsonia sp. CL154]SFM04271.1 Helix-turn-helix [Leifsonia sp. CL147]